MDHILALDAGGSKCDAVVIRPDGTIAGWAKASVPGVGGRALSAVRDAVSAAFRGVDGGELLVAVVGSNLPLDFLHNMNRHQARVVAYHEPDPGFALAGCEHGIILTSGTGAFCYGQMPNRRWRWLDGHGPVLGDFGSGHDIGLRALQAVMRSLWHPRHDTALRGPVCAQLGIDHPLALHGTSLFCQDRSLVASLARLVDEAANAGDAVACSILDDAADALAETFADVVVAVTVADEPFAAIGVGSVIRHSDRYAHRLSARISEIAPYATFHRIPEPPVIGLGVLALRHLHNSDAAVQISRLRQSAATRFTEGTTHGI
jgi:N-acetylglucosamine kinase-like BadF-type ATPase